MAKTKRRRPGTIESRGPNVHLCKVYKGRDASGQRVYVSETVHGTIGQAQDHLSRMVTKKTDGKLVGRSKQTLEAYLLHWLEKEVSISREASTWMFYEDRLKSGVIPILGWKKLSAVTQGDLQSLIEHMHTEMKLAPRTISGTVSIIHTALERAVERKLLAHNPCHKLVLPKDSATVEEEMTVLTAEQIRLFLEGIVGDKDYALFLFLFSTGVRPGEAFGLKWSDIDFTKGEVKIRRSLSRTRQGEDEIGMQWRLKDVKTKRGRRTITVPQETLDALKSHRSQQARRILSVGPSYQRGDDLVFATETGRYVNPINMLQRFQRLLTKAGLPKLRLYDIRHTHITLLLEAGENAEVVSKRAGHASVAFTFKVYFHATPSMQANAASTVGNILFRRAQ